MLFRSLGFIVSHRGIEANPDKIAAIQKLGRPTYLKDVQKLAGCVAALSRFISRLGEKAMPLYRLLKKSEKFTWMPEAEVALEELKKMLQEAPVLAAPKDKEPLLLYIAATSRVVSVVIAVERPEEGKEHPAPLPSIF